jgi:hypothetical protein
MNAWSESYEYNLRVAKRGRAMFSRKTNKNVAAPSEQHNRVKNYILPEGGGRAAAGRYGNLHAGREGHPVSI